MEEIILELVENAKNNFWEIILAAGFLWNCITGNKTEAQKKARALAKHTKALKKAIKKAEKEERKIKQLEGEENASNTTKQAG